MIYYRFSARGSITRVREPG